MVYVIRKFSFFCSSFRGGALVHANVLPLPPLKKNTSIFYEIFLSILRTIISKEVLYTDIFLKKCPYDSLIKNGSVPHGYKRAHR
jgi:hypothetical protein